MSNDEMTPDVTAGRKTRRVYRGRPRSELFLDRNGKYVFNVAPELAFMLYPIFAKTGRKNFFAWLEDLVQEELSDGFDSKRFVGYLSYSRTRAIRISGPALATIERLCEEFETTPLQMVENVLAAVLVEQKPPHTDEA